MERAKIEALLRSVADGEIDPQAAAERLAQLPFADLGFARLDLHRELRGGLPEAIFSEGKTDDDLAAIAGRMLAAHGRLLVTRLAAERAPVLRAAIPKGGPDWKYHERARIFTAGEPHAGGGRILAVLAAGTSDLPVAEEAAVCAEWFGLEVERHFDVGVAGLHRLLAVLPEVRQAGAIIVVAGMDGALPSVTAGLVATPVVAVPTSVGYGAAFGGVAALLSMLNSCAAGVTVVNIDNGFGAAVTAQRMLCPDLEASDDD
ncbi:MAG: nickel pincer cofactor biosynthesis protein LarB [Acidobacteriota bacterium]